jgi:hypothetical protein
MSSFATSASLRQSTASALSRAFADAGVGRIITTATTAISGVRWIVFA